MIVTFDPYINNTASGDAVYVNFLRCVTAIATAAANTSTLTVNPYLNNTGSVDNTKNCIVSIDANAEAGGWTTSASHNVPSSATFTSMNSQTTFDLQWKADFYTASNKGAQPYLKLCFHSHGGAAATSANMGSNALGYVRTGSYANWASYLGQIMITYGSSTASDLSDANFKPTWAVHTPTQPATSVILNCYFSNYMASTTYTTGRGGFNVNNSANVYYRMAVTKDYCIIWDVPRSNSYASGYANTSSWTVSNPTATLPAVTHAQYGTLFYCGLRTTQTWEDALNYNPPWVAIQAVHIPESNTSNLNTDTGPQSTVAAYMATIDNAGATTNTASKKQNGPWDGTSLNDPVASGVMGGGVGGAGDIGGTMSLVCPVINHRQRKKPTASAFNSNIQNMPTVDPVTGSLVPNAEPIRIQTNISGAWNPGGYIRGIYKSMTAPLSMMKLYWLNENQTFTINNEPYRAIVFNEDMYLIRFM